MPQSELAYCPYGTICVCHTDSRVLSYSSESLACKAKHLTNIQFNTQQKP